MRVEAVLLLALAGCASPVADPPDPWRQALQACQLPEQGLAGAAALLQTRDAGLCQRAAEFGQQLDCFGHKLTGLHAAHSRFTAAGLQEFQACLEPLAAGLRAGYLGRPRDIDLALRACVLQLDLSPALPRSKPAWWYARYAATLPVPPVPSTLVATGLPPAAALSWPACEASAALKPATAPTPAPAAKPKPAAVTVTPSPAHGPPSARAVDNPKTTRERHDI